jgi:molybdate transport system substrate-binding protein
MLLSRGNPFRISLCIIVILFGNTLYAEDILVAAASNLSPVMPYISERFYESTGHNIILSYSSTTRLTNLIRNDAPYEVFISADSKSIISLINEGFISPEDAYIYAQGRLVLFANFNVSNLSEEEVLFHPLVNKIAIANPIYAPYGLAAFEYMNHNYNYDEFDNKIVFGANVAQAFQYVEMGVAELGFTPLSFMINGSVTHDNYKIIDTITYPPINQMIGLLKNSSISLVPRLFYDFMRTELVVNYLNDNGYRSP